MCAPPNSSGATSCKPDANKPKFSCSIPNTALKWLWHCSQSDFMDPVEAFSMLWVVTSGVMDSKDVSFEALGWLDLPWTSVGPEKSELMPDSCA